ncbi:RagB/SusD family nutrient uptake outer membrane protein [uncultured Alistipes sp.]|uniref:RagB/SusD family nutrient uptake outer membrane protein n=1 Tax=uncultured Alistipes sp. TaxID=538949 RepID=UPI002604310A|nr:RagB/SusD family nutrient uptake outer membrane protein [uncultured Alistipes sp.]
MNKNIKLIATLLIGASALSTGCLQETFPQQGTVTVDQAGEAPNSFNNFVTACTSTMSGEFIYSGSSYSPYDFGYTSFFLQRDVMGQDIVCEDTDSEHYTTWYTCGVGLGPTYAVCQLPWTLYYGWIKNCNVVISLAGEEPSADHITGAGIAYAMRAMFYMDLARMFAPQTYKGHPDALTVPIITEKTTNEQATNNPNATNEKMWEFILSDLDKAEEYLADYQRPDKTTPDLSVVYGLKARAYLTMEMWAEAEHYAKLAQSGYTMMTEAQYLDHNTGFNTPNDAWMFMTEFDAEDPNITANDGDSSWGSQMILEITEQSGCGYAANYGTPKRIDAHLLETIPQTDWRRKCFIDPELDEMVASATSMEELQAIVAEYLSGVSEYPGAIVNTAMATTSGTFGGLSLKFRAAGGEAGHNNVKIGFCVAVPLMRVEEMMLIEAEAAGMQEEGRGKTLLETFAKTRNQEYEYDNAQSFRDNVWWQRRVELWGEGFATFDIKRFEKGITRSYAGTNHPKGYRWNTESVPDWMNLCIVQTETNYNQACISNPTPIQPTEDSPEKVW